MDSFRECETWMTWYYCAACGRSYGHTSARWVLTEKGREVLEEIRISRSRADALGELAGEQVPRVSSTP